MKKALKSSVVLTFCLCIIMSTIMMASAISNVKNAKATSITYNSATLTWSKVSGADGYEIQQYKSKKWTTIKTISSGSTVSYKLTKLTAGTTYKYRIRAYDKGLIRTTYSDYTSTISVKPVPTQVKDLKATGSNTTTINLTWTKVSGASGYEVQQYISKKWETIKTVTTNSYSVAKLKLGTTYKFRVRAYTTVSKKNVYGSYSSTASGKTIVPAVGTVKSKSISTTEGTVYWGASSDAAGYQVYNPATKKWVNTKTTRSYTAKSLTAGTKYTFKVRAYKKVSGTTYYSSEKSYTFTTTPAQVTGAKLSSITQNSMKASWTKVSGATGYQVYLYDYSGDKKWTLYKSVTTNSVTISGLKAVSQYAVRIRAYVTNPNSTNKGSWSDTLKTYTAPTTPGSVSFSDIKTNAVTVKWSAVSGASGYQVYNPATNKWVDAKTATTYTVSSLSAGTSYTYKVRAYKTSGSTKIYGTAKEASVTTAPAQVTGLKYSNLSTTSFTVSWTKVSGAAGYRVYLYNQSTKKTTSTDTTNLTLTLSNLTPGVKYNVSVAAYVKNSSYTLGATAAVSNIHTYALNTIPVSWSKVTNATKYVLSRYNPTTHAWDTVTTTSSLSYRDDSQGVNTGALYSIAAYNGSTYISTVKTEFSNAGITLSKATNTMTVSWTAPTDASGRAIRSYTIYELPREGSTETDEKIVYSFDSKDTKHTMFTAYGVEQTYVIYANYGGFNNTSDDTRDKVAQFTVRAETLNVSDTSDTGKTSQLLMLTGAINRTKYEQGIVNVTRNSTASFSTDKVEIEASSLVLNLLFTECPSLRDFADNALFPSKITATGTEEVVTFMNAMGESSTVTADEVATTETISESVSFNKGYTYSQTASNNRFLYTYIEPNGTTPYNAYIYNSDDVSAWKNGFSSVSVTKASNGNYTIKAVIKAEEFGTSVNKSQSYYHGGFSSLFEDIDFSGAEGMENALTKIGATTINAEINTNGQLVSYSFSNTTMSTDYVMSMDDLMKMSLEASASVGFSYAFTYGLQS